MNEKFYERSSYSQTTINIQEKLTPFQLQHCEFWLHPFADGC